MSELTEEQWKVCLQVLQSVEKDRSLIAKLPVDTQIEFMKSAGKVSRPHKLDQIRWSKAHRKEKKRKEIVADRKAREQSQIRSLRTEQVYLAPKQVMKPNGAETRLNKPGRCYVCKATYWYIHFFYDSMCERCGDFNYEKRFQSVDLSGKVALVTGGRVKIGFQCAMILLRAGARVIVSTRFPKDAARRFAKEEDFSCWSERLQIYGLDLRHSPGVELFARWLCRTEKHLDILINNAAQTVRRPAGFYAHLMPIEQEPLPSELEVLVAGYEKCRLSLGAGGIKPSTGNSLPQSWQGIGADIGLTRSAELSQIPYAYDDPSELERAFPDAALDADLQQVDLRDVNSWRLALADVPAAEMLEVHLVNAVAPFILCSQLKPLLLASPSDAKHIVNVSAMEGKFTRYTKTDKHPHTNMAKAALNMLTATSAPDYAKDNIYMNAVDTGWVTDEDPAVHATRKRSELGFEPPLDIVDGAARVCDPIVTGYNSGDHTWGKFLKDYTPTAW